MNAVTAGHPYEILVSTCSGHFSDGLRYHHVGWGGGGDAADPALVGHGYWKSCRTPISYSAFISTGVLAVVLYAYACKSIMFGPSATAVRHALLSDAVLSDSTSCWTFCSSVGVSLGCSLVCAVATTSNRPSSMILCLIHLSKKTTAFHIVSGGAALLIARSFGQIVRYGLPVRRAGIRSSGWQTSSVQSNIQLPSASSPWAAYGSTPCWRASLSCRLTCFTMALTPIRARTSARANTRGRKRAATVRHPVLDHAGRADRLAWPCGSWMPQAGIVCSQTPGGHSRWPEAGTDDLAVLFPAGLFARDRVDLPRRGQGVRADDDHAERLVRVPHSLYHDGHAHLARYPAHLFGPIPSRGRSARSSTSSIIISRTGSTASTAKRRKLHKSPSPP